MQESLRNVQRIFPKKDVFDYGREGIRELSKTFVEIAKKHSTRNPAVVVIPSRGAVSPTLHALERILYMALYDPKGVGREYSAILNKISIPPVLEELFKFAGFKGNVVKQLAENKKPVQFILLPFTADVNVEILKNMHKNLEKEYRRYLGMSLSEIPSNTEVKKSIRRGGVRILKALFQRPDLRKPFFHAFTNILELEGRHTVAEYYRTLRLDKNARIYIVDTVISGTAASQICDALREEGLRAVPILLVDKDGKALKKDKKRKLGTWVYTEKGKMINVPTLPAEDRGVGFLGVAALVYPQIGLYLSRKGETHFPTLFGTWIPVTCVHSGYQELFKKFSKVVLAATFGNKKVYDRAYEEFANAVVKYKHLALYHGMAHPRDLAAEIPALVKRGTLLDPDIISHVHETSARVAHLFYTPSTLKRKILPRIAGVS